MWTPSCKDYLGGASVESETLHKSLSVWLWFKESSLWFALAKENILEQLILNCMVVWYIMTFGKTEVQGS